MMATEINWIRFVALFLYVDHYFNNNDNHKIKYLSSSMPQRDKVIYASVKNVTVALTKFKSSCKHWMCLMRYLWI